MPSGAPQGVQHVGPHDFVGHQIFLDAIGLKVQQKTHSLRPGRVFHGYSIVETFQFVSAITVSHECGRRQAPVGELELRGSACGDWE